MRKWLFLLLFIGAFACSSKDNGSKTIPRRDFINLLVDMHIADAIAVNHTINENLGRLDSSILYASILESHGYTRDQMTATFNYYSKDPDKLVDIYDEVFSILSKRADETKKLYSSTTNSSSYTVWKPEKNRYSMYGDTVQYLTPFDISIDTTGTFFISVEIKRTFNDQAINPRIAAYFYDPEADDSESNVYFFEVPIKCTYYTREYTLFREMKNADLTRMRIMIPLQENQDSVFNKGFEIHNLRVGLTSSKKNK
jgi:hypothetical protein